jgi:hypothetical protein
MLGRDLEAWKVQSTLNEAAESGCNLRKPVIKRLAILDQEILPQKGPFCTKFYQVGGRFLYYEI